MPPRRGFKQRPTGSSAALEQALASASQAVSPGGGGGGGVAGKKKAGRRHNVWESDATRPGGKTSMQVVLAWLTAEGNYARWASRSSSSTEGQKAEGQRKGGGGGKRGQTRASLIREVLAAFEAEGIQRTMQDVRNRIAVLEKQYATARKWLRDTGFLLAFERGVADKDVERSVLRLCKYYRELAPRFQEVEAGRPAVTINLDNSTDDNEDAAALRVREGSGGVSPAIDSDGGMDGGLQHVEEEGEHGEEQVAVEESEGGENEDEDEEAGVEQEEIAAASDASSTSHAADDREEEEEEVASSSASNRADNEEEEEEEEEEPAQEASPFEHAEESEEEAEEEHPTRREASKRGVSAQTPTPKRRRLALLPRSDSDDDDTLVADDTKSKADRRAVLLAAAEEQREQRRELFELERAKLQRELELKEIQVAYEKTLARKKLQDAGVALDDIDRVLPL